MVSDRAGPKKSGHFTKGATKRTRPSKESHETTPGSERNAKTRKSAPPVTAPDAALSLAERVELERKRISKALSIIECCRFATATLLEAGDTEYMIPAFEAVCDLLSNAAEELERIGSACERVA